MGSQSIFMTVQSVDKSDIIRAYNQQVKDDIHEYGHNAYNGSFSTLDGGLVLRLDKEFTDREDARRFILDYDERVVMRHAIAVIVKEEGDKPYTLIGGWARI